MLHTAKHCQLVLMALKAGEEIGAEVHRLDQFFRVEEGSDEAYTLTLRPIIAMAWSTVPALMPRRTENISTARRPNSASSPRHRPTPDHDAMSSAKR